MKCTFLPLFHGVKSLAAAERWLFKVSQQSEASTAAQSAIWRNWLKIKEQLILCEKGWTRAIALAGIKNRWRNFLKTLIAEPSYFEKSAPSTRCISPHDSSSCDGDFNEVGIPPFRGFDWSDHHQLGTFSWDFPPVSTLELTWLMSRH